MIDKIIDYHNGMPIYLSDVYPCEVFIGYVDKLGNLFLY